MKKFFACLLAMVMVFGSMCAVFAENPGSSGGSGGAHGMKYPYLFEDFEDEDLGMFPTSRFNTSEYVACVEGGIDGSSKAALLRNTRTGYTELQFPLTHTPEVGEIIHLSAWIKTENTNLTNDKMSLIIYSDATVYRTAEDETLPESKRVGGWVEKSLTETGINKNGWTKVSASYEWNGAVNVRPTAGYDGATGNEVRSCKEDVVFNRFSLRLYGTDLAEDAVTSVNYLIDDVEYYAASKPETEENANIFTNSSFDFNKDGWGVDGNSNSVVVQDANDPAPDGSAGYLKMEPKTETGKIYGAVNRGAVLKMNHMYKVSFWAKLLEAPEGITTGGFWLVQYANNRIKDGNGITTNYPGYIKFNCLPLGEWKHFEFYYLNEYKASTQQAFTTVLRLFAGTDQNNTQHASYCLDDFRCEDLGSVENGDFSIAAAEVGKNNVSGKGTEGTIPAAYDVLGWNENGADITAENGEATVTATADGGNIRQGINVENNTNYKVSFRAKGVGDTVGKNISLKLDRSVATVSDCDVYDVPDTEILGDNWNLTDEWQTFETYYKPNFDVKEGKEATADLIPRLPFMSVEVDGFASGMSYMLDDVLVEKVNDRPTLSDIAVSGNAVPGEQLTLSWRYSHAENKALGNVLVKATVEGAQGAASVGSFTNGNTFTVPEHTFGKDIRFTLMPVDESGLAGKIYEVTAKAPEGTWGKLFYDRKSKRVSAYYTEDADATVLVAAYQGNKLIGTELGEVSITANEKESYKLETLTEAGADRLKVMLWNSPEGGKAMAEYIEVDCTEPYDVNVYLLGDSLCMSYATSSYPQQGWGYYFNEFFGEKATVRNYAVGGRTAVATYYEQKAWPQVKSMAEEGDYLFLALGLNDSGSKADAYEPELTDRVAKYKKYLNLICDEAQELGMTVIFNTLTPTIPQNNAITTQNNWKKWCGYVEEVAEEQGCVCLDVNTPLRKLYFYDEALGMETEEKGDESYAQYFLSPEAMERFKEYPISDEMLNRAATYGDWTHVNEDGAYLIAETVAKLLAESESPLKAYLK